MRCIFIAVIIILLFINCKSSSYDWKLEFAVCKDEDSARRVFRAAALKDHPDKCGDTPECALNFIALREAYIARVEELTGGGGGGGGDGALNADDERWLSGFQKRCRGYNWKEVKSGAAGGWLAWRVGTNGGVSLPSLPVSVVTLSLTPKEVYAAGNRRAFNVTAQRQCPACSGRGLKVDALPACNTCSGNGWVAGAAVGEKTVGEIGRVHTCGACCGSGGTTHICPLCHGSGIETSSSSLKGSIHVHGVKPQTTLHILESWEQEGNDDAAPQQESNSMPPPWLIDPSWVPIPKSVTITFSWLENGGIGAPRAECGGGSYCGGAPLFPRFSFIEYPHIDIDARVSILRWCRSNAVIVPLLNGTSVRILLPTRPRTLPNDGIEIIILRDLGFPLQKISNDMNTNTIADDDDTTATTTTTTPETRGDVRITLRLLYPSRLGTEDISLLADCFMTGNGNIGESEDPVQHVIDSSELVSILSAAQGSEPDDDYSNQNVLCDASDMLRSCLRRHGGYFFY